LISRFFIDRPIFATVLSIVITLAGGISLFALPIALYPPISPPTVQVDCNFAGASAQVVSESVATPIEQQVNGVEDMLYMSSQCTNDGSYNLTVTFKHGVDLNMAQVLVQNRVSLALPLLPDVIKQTGVNVKKKAPDILLAIALNSPPSPGFPSGRFNQLYLSNYAALQVKDELARLPGVSDVTLLGQRDYSMRIWLDPDRLSSRGLEADDVVRAIREQNQQVATGQIGQEPVPAGQKIQIPLSTLGRLTDVEQFENVIVRATHDGRFVRLRDVARVELGAKNEDIECVVNGKPSVSLAIFQLPDANALDSADIVKNKMEELKKDFPAGVDYEIRYDTTPFIRESIDEVFKTLREAVLLVAVVVLLFLQNWRSAVIPLVAVPVAIVGTFAAMAALGFSLNNLTLFGLVLAIGIVVDDAIVVVEAVEHHIEHGLSPRDATIRAMDEVSGPVIAIGLVLTAVFVPCAFISGIVGQFFRQFALTIAVSTIISAFNSLTLSPALAALLLKPRGIGESHGSALPRVAYFLGGGFMGYASLAPKLLGWIGRATEGLETERFGATSADFSWWTTIVVAVIAGAAAGWVLGPWLDRVLTTFFRIFNAGFKKATSVYGAIVGGMLRVSLLVLIFYGGMLYLTYWGFTNTAAGFIPSQDMGYVLINVQLPDSASAERTRAVMYKIEVLGREIPGVKHTQTISGQSLLLSANGSNFGSMFAVLDSFDHRREPGFFKDQIANSRKRYVYSKWPKEKALTPEELEAVSRDPSQLPKEKELTPAEFEVLSHDPPFNKWLPRGKPRVITADDLTGDSIQAELRLRFEAEVPEALMTVLGPPPVRGVGRAGGFKIMVEDRGDFGPKVLQAETENLVAQAKNEPDPGYRVTGLENPKQLVTIAETIVNRKKETLNVTGSSPAVKELIARFEELIAKLKDEASMDDASYAELARLINLEIAKEHSAFVSLISVFRANVPLLYFEANRKEIMTKRVPIQELFDTVRVYLGSLYINDLNLFGRTWQVIVQADHQYRESVEQVRRLKVRNVAGTMVPLGTLATVELRTEPMVLMRYNMYPAAPINGAAAPGVSSGQAIAALAALAEKTLPSAMAYEWTELAYLELQAGSTAMKVFGFAVVMVFLVLAAQYESWSLPLAIILVVPMCLLSAIEGVRIAGQDINIFTQIGFVVLVGLASKNAILIVEFAKQRREEGESPRQAALDACILRLRPIVMTSLAFILGVLPLILSRGAGAEMRRTLGTTVFSGMIGVTLFGIFLTPVFFFSIDVVGELSFFRSPVVRRISSLTLGILSLRVVREAVSSQVRRLAGPKTAPTRKPDPEPTEAVELIEQK
jgi:multidrug efflux pump subunit AcrB